MGGRPPRQSLAAGRAALPSCPTFTYSPALPPCIQTVSLTDFHSSVAQSARFEAR